MNKKTIFLTGMTGTLGTELLRELLMTTQYDLVVLARSKRKVSAADRLKKTLSAKGLEGFLDSRLTVVEGDVTRQGFGLDQEAITKLRNTVNFFFHVAALTALNGTEKQCMNVNVNGTRQAIALGKDLRENGCLERFVYFSTAFVAGSLQNYCAQEDGLPAEPAHANYYEASKYQAESQVRAWMSEGMPVTIFRPSIVVGDSETGEVSDFNVIYPFMRLFAHGMLKTLPTRLDNSFNIVPIDFVIKATLAIFQQDSSVGKTYHLVTNEPPTIGMLLDLASKEYPQIPSIEVVDPDHFKNESLNADEKMVFEMLRPYLGYLNDHLSFETVNTEEALKGSGIDLPRTDYEFLKKIVGYAVEAGYLMI